MNFRTYALAQYRISAFQIDSALLPGLSCTASVQA